MYVCPDASSVRRVGTHAVALDRNKAAGVINFTQSRLPRMSMEKVPKLTVWEHVEGSRVAEDTGIRPFLLPNGKKAFYFFQDAQVADRIQLKLDRPPPRPATLALAMQRRLPQTQARFFLASD